MQGVELNKSLFKAVTQNAIEDIRRLINSGANMNSEFTIDELTTNKLLDDYAINIIENGKTSVDSLLSQNILSDIDPINIIKNYKEVIILQPLVINKIVLSSDSKLSTLQLAMLYGWKQVIVELIKKGSNPNKALGIQGITILQLMCASAVFQDRQCYVFDEDIIQLLFEYGADPNVQDVNGKTFLHYVIISSVFFIAERIRGSNIQTGSDISNDIQRIETYLLNGSNPNIKDNYGCCTAKYNINHYVKYLNLNTRIGIHNLLLDHGSVYVKGNIYSVIMMVKKSFSDDSLFSLEDQVEKFNSEHKQRIEKNSRLINAIKRQEIFNICRLLNEQISPNVRDNDGLSALHLAVKLGAYGIVDLLLDKGANPNIKSWGDGITPLFNAVSSSRADIGELLLKHEANPRIINTKGLTPLYYSVAKNDVEMTELLLKYKANPDVSFQISLLLNAVLESNEDSEMGKIETALEKIKRLAMFLKSRKYQILKYSSFHAALDTAEKNKKENIAKKISDLLDELFKS